MSMDEMKPKGYKRMEAAEKKAKEEYIRKIVRSEIRAAASKKKANPHKRKKMV